MILKIYSFFLGLVLLQGSNSQSHEIGCKDEMGNPVEWFILYKLPRISKSPDPFIKRGVGSFYITSSSLEQWTKSLKGLDDPNSILGQNTRPLWTNYSSKISVLYNDQPPNQPFIDNNGHTKGIILATESGGIWIQHSLPHFPDASFPSFSFPKTGYTNGQTFFCMTLDIAKIDSLGQILLITKPNIYSYSIPEPLARLIPNLESAIQRKKGQKVLPFKTLHLDVSNLNLMVFAKGPRYLAEIYSEWVSPTLKTGLDVQSWLNGPNAYPSNCSSAFQVHNNALNKVSSVDFSTHSDHSKWAVGVDKPFTCLSDLNRMEHQRQRGGAALCTADKRIWKLFKAAVEETMPCPKPS